MNNTFFKATIALAAVIFSIGFLIRSVSPAQAAPTPEEFLEEGTNKIGKYQMSLGIANDPDQIYYNILVWDTETGKSQFYGYNRNTAEWSAWSVNLPAVPVK